MSAFDSIRRHLVMAGALLSLLTGFAPAFLNPRTGLASHLEGVMNGTFLIAAWRFARLSARQAAPVFWLLLYGSYANWLFVTLAAVFGTSGIALIAGEEFSGQVWQE